MRLIDAHELKLAIVEAGQRSRRYKLGEIWELDRDEIWNVIDEQPTVEPERKRGKWIEHPGGKFVGFPCMHYECSECRAYEPIKTNYCPNCGASMEEGEAE